MRQAFRTGLVILLPLILTLLIISFFSNLLTTPFLNFTKFMLVPIFGEAAPVTLISKILILIFLFLFVLLIGFLGKLFLINTLFKLGDYFIHRLPFVNRIYKACQDVVHSLLSSNSKKFSQVVLIPFPYPNNLSVGLVTNEHFSVENAPQSCQKLIPVFIPGTPNPSVGFMLMFKKNQLVYVNMTVEEALKFIVSCGVVSSEFKIIPPQPDPQTSLNHKVDL